MKKPLHKHIGMGMKKASARLTKYLIERDTLFATLWVFIFIIILGKIPLHLGALNPVKLSLKDFDFNDLYYSKVGNKQNDSVEKNITIINIGNADRQGIAMYLQKAASMGPKVIGLDVLFDGPRDSVKDDALRQVIRQTPNLVLAVKYGADSAGRLITGRTYFLKDAQLTGFVNFPYDEGWESIRTYIPMKGDEHDHSLVVPAFTSSILKVYDSTAYERISHKIDKEVTINYTRTLTDKKKQYLVVEADDLMMDRVDSAQLKNKIVLLAYVSDNPNDIEDKKFTPMNEKWYGKGVPDMNGIIVHANILSMVLENNFIKKVPSWGNWIIAIFICWLHMSFFIHYYLESHIWFHLAAKIAQVASAILFVWVGIEIFNRFHLKVDMKLSLVTIIMAVDVIYFYEAWATWMHKKYNYHTVFKPHHH